MFRIFTHRFNQVLSFSQKASLLLATGLITSWSASAQVVVTATDSMLCMGENTTLMATGSSTYVWSPSGTLSSDTGSTVTATPVATTTYQVIGTDTAGNNDTATITITLNPIPTINIATTADGDGRNVCLGNTVTMTATGVPSHMYSWSPDSSLNMSTGASVIGTPTVNTTYNLLTTDTLTGCTRSSDIAITINNTIPTVTITPGEAEICERDTTDLVANSSEIPTIYSWSPSNTLDQATGPVVNAFPTTTTTYTLTGRHLGCEGTAQLTLIVNPEPAISATTSSNASICLDETNVITVNSPSAVNFQWLLPGGILTTTNNVRAVSPNSTQSITIIAIDSIGCTNSTSVLIQVDTSCGIPTSVNELSLESEVNAYFNGNNDLMVELSDQLNGALTLTVYDIRGVQVHNAVINKLPGAQLHTIGLNTNASGLYILNIQSDAGTYQKKMVKPE